MRINCCVPPGALRDETVALPPGESHHLARVLRIGAGQELVLSDGRGVRAEGMAETVTAKQVIVRIRSRQIVPPPAVEITLVQAVCKPDRFEWILQKATELGVRRIQPVLSAHTVIRPKDTEKQMQRWQAIVLNAAQQCGTAWMPDILPLKKLEAVKPEADVVLIGSLQPGARPLRDVLRGCDRAAVRSAALLIGPEGDFTAEETAAAVAAGAIPVTFGPQVLRTETAAVFGISALVYEWF